MVPGRLLLCLQRADLDSSSHTLLHHHADFVAERNERLSSVPSASNIRATVYGHTVGTTPMNWSKAPVSARLIGSRTILPRSPLSKHVEVLRVFLAYNHIKYI